MLRTARMLMQELLRVQVERAYMSPKVSVVIPIYNVENYLEECLDSVLGQTLADLEVICVNDGSTDGSLDIVRRFEAIDRRVKVIDKANAGYGSAMNAGFDLACGEYVGIVEPDDYIESSMYETMYEKAVASPMADVVKCAWKEVAPDGETTVRNPYQALSGSEFVTARSYPNLLHWHPSTPMGLYRRAFLEEHGIRYVEAPGAGWVDNPFFQQVFFYARVIKFCQNPFYNYRVGDFEHSSVLRDCRIPLDRLNDMLDFLEDGHWDDAFMLALAKRAIVYLKRILDSPYYYDQRDEVREEIVRTLNRIPPSLIAQPQFSYDEKLLYRQFSNPPTRRPAIAEDDIEISVIVPIYNVEQYLVQCLESVITQSLEQIEIICVDDRSRDFSRCIVNVLADRDSRIRLISQEKNGGYGKGMNTGLSNSHGKYIGIVEPDDFVVPTMFEELLSHAQLYDLDVCKADFYRFKEEGSGNLKFQYVPMSDVGAVYGKVFKPLQDETFFRYTMNTVTGIYRRSMLTDWGIFWNETPGASFQDNGFYVLTSAVAERFMFVKRALYCNRRDNPNSSVANKGKVYCMNEEYGLIKAWLKDNGFWDTLKEDWASLLFRNELFTYGRIADDLKAEYVEFVAKDFSDLIREEALVLSRFNGLETERLELIMSDPHEFMREREGSNPTKVERLEKEVERYRSSTSYKVGKMVTGVPRAIKRAWGKSCGKRNQE